MASTKSSKSTSPNQSTSTTTTTTTTALTNPSAPRPTTPFLSTSLLPLLISLVSSHALRPASEFNLITWENLGPDTLTLFSHAELRAIIEALATQRLLRLEPSIPDSTPALLQEIVGYLSTTIQQDSLHQWEPFLAPYTASIKRYQRQKLIQGVLARIKQTPLIIPLPSFETEWQRTQALDVRQLTEIYGAGARTIIAEYPLPPDVTISRFCVFISALRRLRLAANITQGSLMPVAVSFFAKEQSSFRARCSYEKLNLGIARNQVDNYQLQFRLFGIRPTITCKDGLQSITISNTIQPQRGLVSAVCDLPDFALRNEILDHWSVFPFSVRTDEADRSYSQQHNVRVWINLPASAAAGRTTTANNLDVPIQEVDFNHYRTQLKARLAKTNMPVCPPVVIPQEWAREIILADKLNFEVAYTARSTPNFRGCVLVELVETRTIDDLRARVLQQTPLDTIPNHPFDLAQLIQNSQSRNPSSSSSSSAAAGSSATSAPPSTSSLSTTTTTTTTTTTPSPLHTSSSTTTAAAAATTTTQPPQTTTTSNSLIDPLNPPATDADGNPIDIGKPPYRVTSINGRPVCPQCRKTYGLQRCSSCREVVYCSREHQLRDWPYHRDYCRQLRIVLNQQTMKQKNLEQLQDIEAVGDTHEKVSLHCVLSCRRCVIPVRGLFCTHKRCFDLVSWLEIHSKPTINWNHCPYCNQPLLLDDLRVSYRTFIACQQLPADVEEVVLGADGFYCPVQQVKSSNNNNNNDNNDDDSDSGSDGDIPQSFIKRPRLNAPQNEAAEAIDVDDDDDELVSIAPAATTTANTTAAMADTSPTAPTAPISVPTATTTTTAAAPTVTSAKSSANGETQPPATTTTTQQSAAALRKAPKPPSSTTTTTAKPTSSSSSKTSKSSDSNKSSDKNSSRSTAPPPPAAIDVIELD